MKAFQEFADKNDKIRLSSDKEHVDRLIDGLFVNEKETGMRLCPCRIRNGTREGDLKLICPCNFFAQDSFNGERGECWCGLFVKNK